jgi:hypothetical protein
MRKSGCRLTGKLRCRLTPDPGIDHAGAVDPDKVGGRRVGNQQAGDIEFTFDVVRSRAGEAGAHAPGSQRPEEGLG